MYMKWEPLNTDGEPVRLAVVDDHPLMLIGIKHLVATLPEYVITLSLRDARLFDFQIPVAERPHIAIVDMYMPHMDGEQTLRTIRQHWPETRLLAISVEKSAANVSRAEEAGACGFLPKDMDPDCLHEALQSVQRRGHYHNAELYRELLADGNTKKQPVLEEKLSARERQVLDCVCTADEPTWEMVADRLRVEVTTVYTHRKQLLAKLQKKSKAGLVSYGQTHGYGKGLYWVKG